MKCNWIGIFIGILIGIITGIITLAMIKTIIKRDIAGKTIALFNAQIASVPTIWFGGPWVTGRIFSEMNWNLVLPFYIVGLTITYIIIMIRPLIKYITNISKGMA